MLAPMQGLTNRGMRTVVGPWARPDVFYTEFMRVRAGARRLLTATDYLEARQEGGPPLVVQLIGAMSDAMVQVARMLQDAGVRYLDLNMGCPAGRMSTRLSGGGWFKDLPSLSPFLAKMRETFSGCLSMKLRAGFDDPRQVFDVVPLLEDAGVDYVAFHPRTVKQKYTGHADHALTRELVAATALPVIANGDICDVETATRVLGETGAAGLMLGRAAIGDPLLFERIRGNQPAQPTAAMRVAEMQHCFVGLEKQYQDVFQGDKFVLIKLKTAMFFVQVPALDGWLTSLRRAKTLAAFMGLLGRPPA